MRRLRAILAVLCLVALLMPALAAPAGAAATFAFTPATVVVPRGATTATVTATLDQGQGLAVFSLFYYAGSSYCTVTAPATTCAVRLPPTLRPGTYLLQATYFGQFPPSRVTGTLIVTP